MDILTNPFVALGAGLLAAFTPCTLALIPILLYRFGLWGGQLSRKGKRIDSFAVLANQLSQLIIGYLLSFSVMGLLLGSIIGSDLANISRLVIGSALVALGVMQFGGGVSFRFIQKVSNPFLLGLALPLVVSISPCVLPVLAPFVGLSASTGTATIVSFLFFGLGVLIPAVIIALSGNQLLSRVKNLAGVMAKIDKVAAALIIVSGVYLGTQQLGLTRIDTIIVGLLHVVFVVWIAVIVLKNEATRTVTNLARVGVWLFASIVLASGISILTTNQKILRGQDFIYACSDHTNQISWEALAIVLAYSLISGTGVAIYLGRFYKQSRKLKLKLN